MATTVKAQEARVMLHHAPIAAQAVEQLWVVAAKEVRLFPIVRLKQIQPNVQKLEQAKEAVQQYQVVLKDPPIKMFALRHNKK